jgi:hypothetical protein
MHRLAIVVGAQGQMQWREVTGVDDAARGRRADRKRRRSWQESESSGGMAMLERPPR